MARTSDGQTYGVPLAMKSTLVASTSRISASAAAEDDDAHLSSPWHPTPGWLFRASNADEARSAAAPRSSSRDDVGCESPLMLDTCLVGRQLRALAVRALRDPGDLCCERIGTGLPGSCE